MKLVRRIHVAAFVTHQKVYELWYSEVQYLGLHVLLSDRIAFGKFQSPFGSSINSPLQGTRIAPYDRISKITDEVYRPSSNQIEIVRPVGWAYCWK